VTFEAITIITPKLYLFEKHFIIIFTIPSGCALGEKCTLHGLELKEKHLG